MAPTPEFEPQRLHEALTAMYERATRDHRLAAEAQRARREFFAGAAFGSPAGELRFREWFLLERDSEALGAVPCEVLDLPADEHRLTESVVSVFDVVQAAPADARAGTAELGDLQADESYDVVAPPQALQPGDLLVGRLYPARRGFWQLSPAIALYRPGRTIGAAFQRDLARLGLDRHLSQVELEHLLLRRAQPTGEAGGPSPLERLEARLDSLLQGGGATASATAISDALRQAERPGPVIGPLLDQLAFETEVDLERARQLLLEMWNAHHASPVLPTQEPAAAAPEPEATGESLGERLVRTLDEGLAGKQDVEELFQKLEAMAGIAPEEADENPFDAAEEAAESALRDEAGDVGDLDPLVQEFLWEGGHEEDATAHTLQQWVELQQNAAVPRTDLEQVTGQDLMRLLLHVYLGAAPGSRAPAVREAFDVLQRFYAWAEREQELPVADALRACRGPLLEELDRLQAAGQALSGPQVAGARPPTLLRVGDVDARGIGVQIDDGGDLWIRTEAAPLLREGDLLLAATRGKGPDAQLSGLVVVLPSDAEGLMS